MKRAPEPHGTHAAYMRHRRAGEEPCDACKKAKPKRPAIQMQERTVHTNKWDKALEKNPPVIKWQRNRHGVMVAVSIYDPHQETTAQARRDREIAALARQEAEDAAAYREWQRTQALKCTNDTLLSAARTDI